MSEDSDSLLPAAPIVLPGPVGRRAAPSAAEPEAAADPERHAHAAPAVDEPAAAQPPVSADEEFEATIVMARPATTTPWKLIDIDGAEFPLGQHNVFGRRPLAKKSPDGAQLIALSDLGRVLSRTHALIEVDGEQLWVTDLGSTNGTEIVFDDEEPLDCTPGERVAVPRGSSVSLGGREVMFEAPDASRSTHARPEHPDRSDS